MIEVVCGVIKNDIGEVLIVQRGKEPNKGKWEFPGGKVELGETHEQALARELNEELGIEVEIGEFIIENRIQIHENVFQLFFYSAFHKGSKIELFEHLDGVWIKPHDLDKFDLSDGDKKIVEHSSFL